MSQPSHDALPPLLQDRGFWGLNLTQFLGAFNDNLYKQLVMLLCLDYAQRGGKDLQGLALVLFAVPFILLSGFAGFLSDKYSKRTIVLLCKIAEVIIVLFGMIGFATESLALLLAILCLMGVHSAFFGPPKYGILPEMLRGADLPRANGMILMTTFLAIIFGFSAAGIAKDAFQSNLWMASLPCLVIAIGGVMTSLMIRRTAVAEPNLKFEFSSFAIAPDTIALLRRDRQLLSVLMMSSVFWFVGGIFQPTSNSFGKEQLGLPDRFTAILAASSGIGIGIGCVLAGILSKDRVRSVIVRTGAWGITLSLALLACPGPGWTDIRAEIRESQVRKDPKITSKPESDEPASPASKLDQDNDHAVTKTLDDEKLVLQIPKDAKSFYRGTLLGPYWSAIALVAVGLFAGLYSVPHQVYLQSMSPTEQKGRIIGAMNLLNWIGIAGAGVIYSLGRALLIDWLQLPYASLFGFAALMMLPVAIFYRPPNVVISDH